MKCLSWIFSAALLLSSQAPPEAPTGFRARGLKEVFRGYAPADGPEAPTGFRARGLTSDEVLLWWRDDVKGAERLRLEINEGPSWRPVAEMPASAIVYSVRPLEPARRWRFRLGAVGASGEVA